jgi:DnaK suppressor protein
MKKKTSASESSTSKTVVKRSVAPAKPHVEEAVEEVAPPTVSSADQAARLRRQESLRKILLEKRQEMMKEISSTLEQSLSSDQQRRLESAMDVGDQAMAALERELGISLLEMQNRKRQMIDEALHRLDDGTYGVCADCGVEISERRLQAIPFAKLCVECQSNQELLDKIEKGEDRD